MENMPAEQKTYSQKDLELIKNSYARNTTDQEFDLFMTLARRYALDPFMRQIWAVKYRPDEPARIFTGRDGFLEIAHRSGQFDGMDSDVVEKDGKVVGAWATVYRKDMQHPIKVTVRFDEYRKDTPIWQEKPATMIQKVAESQALRKAFSASGIYVPEEFGDSEGQAKPEMRNVTPPPRSVPTLLSDKAIIDADAKQAEELSAGLERKFPDEPKKKRQEKVHGKWVDKE